VLWLTVCMTIELCLSMIDVLKWRIGAVRLASGYVRFAWSQEVRITLVQHIILALTC
jgi:hypothetical protein